MKKTLLIFITLIMSLSLFLVGCSNDQENGAKKQKDKITVYTTVYPLQFFTEQIGGEFVTVDTIYPPGADEHTFDPTQKDMMKLVDADVFFYIGLGLEGFVNKAKETLKNEDVKMIATTENIKLEDTATTHAAEATSEEDVHEDEDEHGHTVDPHVWLDPLYAKELALSIKDALVAQMPAQKETFEENYQALTADLDELDASFAKTVESANKKEILVSHAAYGYWEKRYGIKQISISGLTTTNEPSQKKLEEIINTAKAHNIKYMLFEQNVSSKLAKVVEKELGAKPLTLHNLSTLTQKNINNKDNYLTIMEQNIKTLEKALH
ncbi:zinc ABC transporter solute-binding protein [Bacillus sp. DNRA2]|uniref:metal ABC transporter solute-binding protein, Zn/Mn family n=1 Tax=Bacillus sp. DNRA2 TaxID=2723053 RepID=UPI00145CEA76|nr:zinc ABC transporter substrate-binding protein [Bacillus sp. DNRA2]NMD72129.1 zinc ABC transporter solute-binding protein [Bacillus sp. DNRA2]